MKKKFLVFVLTLSAFGFSGVAFASGYIYDQKVSLDGQHVATLKIVAQDSQIKAESDFQGIKIIMLRGPQGTFSYYPEKKMAAKIPQESDPPNLTALIPQFQDYLAKSAAKKTGAETVDGKECEIYEFIEPSLDKPAKVWMWKEKQFPLRIEVTAPDGLTLIELQNIEFDPQIPAAAFSLPPDVQIVDMENPPAEETTPQSAPAEPEPQAQAG